MKTISLKNMKTPITWMAWLLAAAGSIALILLLPVVHLVIAAVNLVAHLFIMLLQWMLVRQPRVQPQQVRVPDSQPFISIHVPAYNEPPEMLKRTLDHLARLDWDNYEVLVIDNNTKDESLWRPIAEYCEELGSKFRFLHVENMAGFKAGAMNWARQFMNERAEFIFVVDADYLVDSNALKRAMTYYTGSDIGLIQFPQDYRNVGTGNRGVTLDFKHFFSAYMNMANRFQCVPSTGTLSLVQIKALKAIEGFATEVITEDADLGLRLGEAGYRTVYAHESVGQGVMPHELEGMKKQRWRWAFGNAQILKLGWRALLGNRKLSLTQKLGYVAHLTAWFNFNMIPSVSLVVLAGATLMGPLNLIQHVVLGLSAGTLISFYLLRFLVFYSGLRRDGHSLGEILAGFASHVGMGWIFSASWLKCLLDHRSPFIRTNKFVGELMPGPIKATWAELSVGILLMGSCGVLASFGHFWAAAGALAVATARLLIYWVWNQTKSTLELTRRDEKNQSIARPAWSKAPTSPTRLDTAGSRMVLERS